MISRAGLRSARAGRYSSTMCLLIQHLRLYLAAKGDPMANPQMLHMRSTLPHKLTFSDVGNAPSTSEQDLYPCPRVPKRGKKPTSPLARSWDRHVYWRSLCSCTTSHTSARHLKIAGGSMDSCAPDRAIAPALSAEQSQVNSSMQSLVEPKVSKLPFTQWGAGRRLAHLQRTR